MYFIFILLIGQLPTFAVAAPAESVVTSMVPQGRIVERSVRDFKVKTIAGTKIKMEFRRDGNLEEASGMNLNRGDIFEPGQSLLSLSSAAQLAVKSGHSFNSFWNLEEDTKYGWVYEFRDESELESVQVLLDAKTGKLITEN